MTFDVDFSTSYSIILLGKVFLRAKLIYYATDLRDVSFFIPFLSIAFIHDSHE